MKFLTILILTVITYTNYAAAQTPQAAVASATQTNAEDEIKNL